LKGFRIEARGDITLEPAWHQARAFVAFGHQAQGIAAAQLGA